MKKTIKSFFKIFSWKTLIVAVLSVTSTYLCGHFQFEADFPLTLIGIAVVFPLVFSINSAYKRRETALIQYGILKALGRSIYLANRDWITDPKKENLLATKKTLGELFTSCNEYFHSTGDEQLACEKTIYKCFADLSDEIKGFREQGLGSEMSRVNQYLSKMLVAFEQLKHIHQYRTPVSLRAYSKVYILVLPILYGPYFATVSHGPIMYILPILFSMIFVSLDTIQEHLENPFDRKGEDDIYINSEKFIKGLDV